MYCIQFAGVSLEYRTEPDGGRISVGDDIDPAFKMRHRHANTEAVQKTAPRYIHTSTPRIDSKCGNQPKMRDCLCLGRLPFPTEYLRQTRQIRCRRHARSFFFFAVACCLGSGVVVRSRSLAMFLVKCMGYNIYTIYSNSNNRSLARR